MASVLVVDDDLTVREVVVVLADGDLVVDADPESDPTNPVRLVTVWGVGYRWEPAP